MSFEFWIDVGGTFTDCIGRRPDCSLVRTKVLSTGVAKGRVAPGSTRERIVDPLRAAEPPGFWSGATLRVLDATGKVSHEARVGVAGSERSDGPALCIATPLAIDPEPGQSYELSTGEEAPLLAIRLALGLPLGAPLPPLVMKLGTTRGTNALLTRRGARVAFVTTRGLADVLRIGYQNRPKLFELAIKKPPPLFAATIEIDERLAADGSVLLPLDEMQAREQFRLLRQSDPPIDALAICLLHATVNPAHERRLAELAREAGFAEVSVSHEVAPLVRIVPRGDTTVVDAYLNPVLRDYVARLSAALAKSPAAEIRLLTSAGGLVAAERFTGKDSILSGPAGGVVGFSRVAQAAGFERAIGFDMGGTSTDVARFDGRFEIEHETQKAGVRIVAPMLAIETVAAGGGSICRFDGAKLVVGPESAAADPGPASYGRGGPLAVTDLNLWLGKIVPEHFPFPLDRAAVAQRLDELIGQIEQATGRRYGREELAAGLVRVANANMAQAIRSISVAKGYDPRDYALVAFGGAAMQHACAVATELGIMTIISHPDAGLLSAYGIGLADVVRHRVEGIYAPWNQATAGRVPEIVARLASEATEQVAAEGVPGERIQATATLELRYQGVDASLMVPWEGEAPAEPRLAVARRFAAEHRRLYGYEHAGRPLELVAVRVEAVGRSQTELLRSEHRPPTTPTPSGTRAVWFEGREQQAVVYERAQLRPGDQITGPAIVVEFAATTVIEPGWEAEMLTGRELVVRRSVVGTDGDAGRANSPSHIAQPDPVELEIFHHRFAGIAERMGITLRQTASSVNVKERLDFSCALFTAAGELVVNAPHIPVHLGAMGETVRRVLADTPDLAPGDVIVTNDPYRGGSHLPDVTVVTPVHDAATGELLFFTASRAHHAEIGGIRPGSMPPFSKNLAEEGIVLRNVKAVAGGVSRLDEVERLLRSGPYPSRAVADNMADTSAQIAANQQGVRDLLSLVAEESWPVVSAYMRHIQDAAERKTRAALARLPEGTHRFVDHLDDGSPIAVAIAVAGGEATIDFAGTGPVLATNLNANRAIVTAAVMYVLRCLLNEDIPLNQGVLAPVKIVLPECLLNPTARERAEDCPAVVGGNVETSQRVVDALLGALGLAAASQGTMNNLLFGDETFGYYETICGGSGATAAAAGADAVHTHMTNTRLTDVEVLERRYPVRVREFAIRRGSGGAGQHRGGNGVLRRLEFLRPLRLSLLTTRRGPYPPYGLAGGSPGALGRNTLLRADGTREPLAGAAQIDVQPGDVLLIETPGGGGCGPSVGQAF